MINREELKETLLSFTVDSVEGFLAEHPNVEFYVFAYDCNAEYAEVNLSFNTEEHFEKTLKGYQSGDYAKYYQTQESIDDLRYSPGDWQFPCFETNYVLSDDDLTAIFNTIYPGRERVEDFTAWHDFVESLMVLFCEVMLDFTKTETYQKLPKTADFKVICIDHDEDLETALERFENIAQHS